MGGADISPAGQRFLMTKYQEIQPKPADKLVLIQNWLEGMKRLAPLKK
jgi:hypothetical protein